MSYLVLDKSNYLLTNRHQPITRTPYPFQEKAFLALDRLKVNNPSGFSSMLVLPTGAGKTFTAAHWIIKNYIDQGVKVLWVAHRSELLRQAAEAFFSDTTSDTLPTRDSYKSYVISSEFGRSCNLKQEDLVIASRQSICSSTNMEYFVKWAKGRGLKADRRLLIVFDEAHHAAASSYRTIIKTMKKYIPHIDILGLTATPYRTAKNEQGSLKNIFTTGTGIAYSIDMNTLISAEILANPNHIQVPTNVDMTQIFDVSELKKIAKYDLSSLSEKSLEKLNKNTKRNQLIVDTYLANRKKYGKTIVFAVDVLNAIALNSIFQSVGVKSDFVVSGLIEGLNRSASTERNPRIIRAFKEGALDVLINVNIVTEGTDIPNVETVFLARPTTSKILMTQMIGRGLRGKPAGGTSETNLVYFVDDWKGLVDFVSPTALMNGDDEMSDNISDHKKLLKHYIRLDEISAYAVGMYEMKASYVTSHTNIIPYGVIKCAYMKSDEYGEETEFVRDILVFDEAADIYRDILSEIPALFTDTDMEYTAQQIRKASIDLFFKYCEHGNGDFIGISSEMIQDIVLTYLSSQECPRIQAIDDRVSLLDIVESHYKPELTEEEIEKIITDVWDNSAKVRMWYDRDFYRGMMHVYFNRKNTPKLNAPEFTRPPKEKMDMGELKKYYPAYYQELREYLLQSMKKDDEGYYYSAIQDKESAPCRSKYLHMFEMDHIKPISLGGLTVKENLQMILRSQNIIKNNKYPKEKKPE